MERINETIAGLMRQWEAKYRADPSDTPEGWLKKILTKKELGHIKVKYFHKGTMGLSVDSSTWLYYFSLRRDEIEAKLRQQSGQVKAVRLRIEVSA